MYSTSFQEAPTGPLDAPFRIERHGRKSSFGRDMAQPGRLVWKCVWGGGVKSGGPKNGHGSKNSLTGFGLPVLHSVTFARSVPVGD